MGKINDIKVDWTSDEGKYWLGFIMADGCLYRYPHARNKSCLYVAQSNKDGYVMEELKTFLGWFGSVSNHNGVTHYRLGSFIVCDQLQELGIMPRKSGKEIVPKGCSDSSHFWRGMVDGDGCVSITSKNRIVFNLVGSEEICNGLLTFIKNRGVSVKSEVHPIRLRNGRTVQIYSIVSSDRVALAALAVVYPERLPYGLQRKFDVYKNYSPPFVVADSWQGFSERLLSFFQWVEEKYPDKEIKRVVRSSFWEYHRLGGEIDDRYLEGRGSVRAQSGVDY